jgi:hypothetical protein
MLIGHLASLMPSATLCRCSLSNWGTRHTPRLQSARYLALLRHHYSSLGDGFPGEGAMRTGIDFAHHDPIDRYLLWDRFEPADVFEHYRKVQAQGVSQHQAAKQLQVSRTTLPAWHSWHATLDICPPVAQCFQSGPDLACVLERRDKAVRVVPNMQATSACVAGYVRQQGNQLALALPVSYAMPAQLMPSFYLERVAQQVHSQPWQATAGVGDSPSDALIHTGGRLESVASRAPEQLATASPRVRVSVSTCQFECRRAQRISVAAPSPASRAGPAAQASVPERASQLFP